MHVNRDKVHQLVNDYVPTESLYNTFYQQLMLRSPSKNWPKLSSIDFWLLACPFSWRELAWCFFKCKIPTAVIEIKTKYIEGDHSISVQLILLHVYNVDESWDHSIVPTSKMSMEKLLSNLHQHAKKMQESNDWLKFSPCVPLNLLISYIQRAEGSPAADSILENFHVKGDIIM